MRFCFFGNYVFDVRDKRQKPYDYRKDCEDDFDVYVHGWSLAENSGFCQVGKNCFYQVYSVNLMV